MHLVVLCQDIIYREGLKSLLSSKYPYYLHDRLSDISKDTKVSASAATQVCIITDELEAESREKDEPEVYTIGLLNNISDYTEFQELRRMYYCLCQRDNFNEIIKGVDNLLEKKRYYSYSLIADLFEQDSEKPDLNHLELSDKELAILKLTYEELSSKQVADKLNLSVRTVEWYKKRMMEKTNAKNVIGLIRRAVQNGYL